MGKQGANFVILFIIVMMGAVACSSATDTPTPNKDIIQKTEPLPAPLPPTPTPSDPPPPPKTLKDIVEGQGNASLTSNNMDLVVNWTGGLIDASYTQAKKLFDKAFEKSTQSITEPTDKIQLDYNYEESGALANVKGLVIYSQSGGVNTEYTVDAEYKEAVLDTNFTLNGSSNYHEKVDVNFEDNGNSQGISNINLDGLFAVSGVIGAKIEFDVVMQGHILGGNFNLVKIDGTANVESGGNHFGCIIYGEHITIKKTKLDNNGQPVIKFDEKSQTNIIVEVEETLQIKQPMIKCEAK